MKTKINNHIDYDKKIENTAFEQIKNKCLYAGSVENFVRHSSNILFRNMLNDLGIDYV